MRSLCGALMVLAACGFHPSGDGGNDVDATADADEGDGASTDGAEIDSAAIDAAMIDAAMIDARTDARVDAAIVDARIDATVDAAVDAGIDARPPCPGTYDVTSGGDNYRFVAVAQVWSVAAADCNDDLGGGRTHLATFEVASEMDPAIVAINPGNSAEPLVGAACSSIDCSTTAVWGWVTGTPVAASLWDAGQPDNGFVEKAAEATRQNGNWVLANVTQNGTTRPYICECDP